MDESDDNEILNYEQNLETYKDIKEELKGKEYTKNVCQWYAVPEAWALANTNEWDTNSAEDYLTSNNLYHWIKEHLTEKFDSFSLEDGDPSDKKDILHWFQEKSTNNNKEDNDAQVKPLFRLVYDIEVIQTLQKKQQYEDAIRLIQQHSSKLLATVDSSTILQRVLLSVCDALRAVKAFYDYLDVDSTDFMSCARLASDALFIAVPDGTTSTKIAEHLSMIQFVAIFNEVLSEPNLFEVLEILLQIGKLLSTEPKLSKLLPYTIEKDTLDTWVKASDLSNQSRYIESVSLGVKVLSKLPIDENIKEGLIKNQTSYEALSEKWQKNGASWGYSRFAESLNDIDRELSDSLIIYFDAISLVEAQIQAGEFSNAAQMIEIIMDKISLPKRHLKILAKYKDSLNEVHWGLTSGLYQQGAALLVDAMFEDMDKNYPDFVKQD